MTSLGDAVAPFNRGRCFPHDPMPDGRMAALRVLRGEESPGSTEARCRVTPGGGDPRESATENIPPSPNRFANHEPAGGKGGMGRAGRTAPPATRAARGTT